MKPLIIGLGYRARSGKDTVGAYLVQRYGFKRFAFADILKRVVGLMTDEDPFDPAFKQASTRLDLTGGQALQQIGVKLREIDPDIWIKAGGLEILAQIYPNIVITDCRFLNEAKFIRNLGGVLWCINRPGLPEDEHISEQEGKQINWDLYFPNSGTIEGLKEMIDAVINLISEPPAPYTPADEQGTQRALQGLE